MCILNRMRLHGPDNRHVFIVQDNNLHRPAIQIKICIQQFPSNPNVYLKALLKILTSQEH